jgi:hypothetical protein
MVAENMPIEYIRRMEKYIPLYRKDTHKDDVITFVVPLECEYALLSLCIRFYVGKFEGWRTTLTWDYMNGHMRKFSENSDNTTSSHNFTTRLCGDRMVTLKLDKMLESLVNNVAASV